MITTKLVLPTSTKIHETWPELNKESKDLSAPGMELPPVDISEPQTTPFQDGGTCRFYYSRNMVFLHS
jgi:hypothetical protein